MTLAAASLVGTIRPFWVGYLDFLGDPVRVCTLPYDWTPTGTGDADLDGLVFMSFPAAFINVSPVRHQADGSDTVSVSLSGIPGADTTLLTALADRSKWRGRVARLWRGLANSEFVPTVLEGYYTGYMMQPLFAGDPTTQTVQIQIENYLAVMIGARRRTYQDNAEHDPLDISPARIRAAANGIEGTAGLPGGNGYGNTAAENGGTFYGGRGGEQYGEF